MTTLLINGTEQPANLVRQYREALIHKAACEKAERLATIEADHARDICAMYAERLGIGRRLRSVA